MRPGVGLPDIGDLDVSPLIRPENLFPFGEHGGFSLLWSSPKTREVHTYIRKAGRGRWALDAAREMIGIAFAHGTERLWTKIAAGARHVELFARASGMQPTGEVVEYLGTPHNVFALETASCR